MSSCTVEPRSGMPGSGIWKCLPWNENDLLVQRATNDLHRLLEHLAVERIVGGLVGVVLRSDRHALVVEVQHLAGHRAATDAEDRPAARQVVERGEVLGETQRVPLRHDVEHRAEPQRRGLRGDPRRDQQAVRDHLVALVLEVVLGRPERVVTEPFGLLGRVHVVEGGLPAGFVRVSPIHRGGRAGAGIVHLDAAEEERAQFQFRSIAHGRSFAHMSATSPHERPRSTAADVLTDVHVVDGVDRVPIGTTRHRPTPAPR